MTTAGGSDALTLHGFFIGTLAGKMPQGTVTELELISSLSEKLDGTGDAELSDAEHEALAKAVPGDLPGTVLIPLMPILRAIAGAS